MAKTDLLKKHKAYYTAKKSPGLVQLGEACFLSIEGEGDPNGPEFARKVQTLYVAAYAVKFLYKSGGLDFVVPKLEALWWFDEQKYGQYALHAAPQKVSRDHWQYQLLIRMPQTVGDKEVQQALGQVRAQKQLADLKAIRLVTLNEGNCVQVLHTGPFENEPKTLQRLEAFMQENKLEHNGRHHEIYLSDFRKTSPDKLKTILREPVKRADESMD